MVHLHPLYQYTYIARLAGIIRFPCFFLPVLLVNVTPDQRDDRFPFFCSVDAAQSISLELFFLAAFILTLTRQAFRRLTTHSCSWTLQRENISSQRAAARRNNPASSSVSALLSFTTPVLLLNLIGFILLLIALRAYLQVTMTDGQTYRSDAPSFPFVESRRTYHQQPVADTPYHPPLRRPPGDILQPHA